MLWFRGKILLQQHIYHF
uniref:Uncharacterized protein n=1 Tax=Anguilla anguilla TaxID=7936 RepID=A0A0E9QRK9_ANGAN